MFFEIIVFFFSAAVRTSTNNMFLESLYCPHNMQICDMVTIARNLNVTLIVPELDKTSFWADSRSDQLRLHKDFVLALLGLYIPFLLLLNLQ